MLPIVLFAQPQPEDDYAVLAAQLIAAGTNEFEDERHSVQIDDCVITTYRWRDLPDHGWTLWSSFHFHISDVELAVTDPRIQESYIFVQDRDAPSGEAAGTAIILFQSYGDILVRHERSVLREPTPTDRTGPSPRGDGTSHYYEWRSWFVVSLSGPFAMEKGRDFTRAYQRLASDYCTKIG